MFWNDARINCLKNEADLASLSDKKLDIVKEYLEQLHVRRLGAGTISIGLFRIGNDWKWLNGKTYNDTIPFKGVTKARLAWNYEDNTWMLEAADTSDLYFCEKMRGETKDFFMILPL